MPFLLATTERPDEPQLIAVPVVLMLALMPTLACASEEGPAGRYQLTVGPGAFGDAVFMIDTATGRTWQ